MNQLYYGKNARPDDLPVNPCKVKKLNNMRSQGDGKGVSLALPLVMTLEYIDRMPTCASDRRTR